MFSAAASKPSMHARAFATVRKLERVMVFSPTEARREAFAATLSDELGVPCDAVATPEAAIAESTIALAAARSYGEEPILFGHWLSPGTTTVSIGSTVPSQREVDTTVVERADLIVCDVPDEVVGESGDILEAKRAGISVEHKTFSLSSLIRGELDEHRRRARFPMYKSVGGGFQDVVLSEMVLTKAIEAGRAQPLPVAFTHKRI